jgi:two-component system cell cycle sensor histidine kinase/response regulator CckA
MAAPTLPRQASVVLVVDDEPAVRRIIQRLLERAGYTVLLAGDGEAALELVERHPEPLNLLISDIVLPGLPGPEVAERVRHRHRDVKVLYSSGYPGDELTRRGLGADAAFLSKPFTPDELVSAVADLLAADSGP